MRFAPQRRALFRHLNFQKWSDTEVFCTFWLGNVFAPQRRALFRHRNFQKWSDAEVFWTFWLRNVLRATTACNFSSLIWPDGSAPAALASLLFDPPELQIIGKTWKNTVFRDFPTFSRICIFFLLILSLLWSSLFYSPLLSASAQLCFSSVHIVWSLTSKLPSITVLYESLPETVAFWRLPRVAALAWREGNPTPCYHKAFQSHHKDTSKSRIRATQGIVQVIPVLDIRLDKAQHCEGWMDCEHWAKGQPLTLCKGKYGKQTSKNRDPQLVDHKHHNVLPRLTSHRLAFQLQHSQTSRTLPDANLARKILAKSSSQLKRGEINHVKATLVLLLGSIHRGPIL